MSDDLDDRIAYLKQQRDAEGAAQTQRASDLIQTFDELQGLVRETSFKSATVQAKMQLLEVQMNELEARLQRTRLFLVLAISVSLVFSVLVLALSFWLGRILV